MVLPIFAQFGLPSLDGPITRSTGTGSATPPSVDSSDGNGAPAPTTVDPAAQAQASGLAPNILAMLPSAQKAKQDAPSSFGQEMAAAVDSATGKSKLGAFVSGFAHGMKAREEAQIKQNKTDSESDDKGFERMKTLFGLQKDLGTQAETVRHNQATETNAARSTSNLGDYYKSIAEGKSDKTPGATDVSLGLQRAQTVSGFKPGDPAFESLDPAVKNAARDRFGAFYRDTFKKDPPGDLLGKPYGGDNPTSTPEHQSLWQRLFGGGDQPATPAPAPPNVAIREGNKPPVSAPAVPITSARPAPAPAPPTAPASKPLPPGLTADLAKQQARAAIAAGADAAKVKERLQSLGLDDSDL